MYQPSVPVQRWLGSEELPDRPSTPPTHASSYYSMGESDGSHSSHSSDDTARERSAAEAYDEKTSTVYYRLNNLCHHGITMLLPIDIPPSRISDMVNQIRTDNFEGADDESKYRTSFEAMHKAIEIHLEISSEHDLRSVLSCYLPLTSLKLYKDFPSLVEGGMLWDMDRKFSNKALDRFVSGMDRLATPRPDLTFGYSSRSLYDEVSRYVLRELVSSGFTSEKTPAGLYYPYFFIEHKPVGGGVFFAQNQCMADTAVALDLNRPVIDDDENVVYSLAMNEREVSIHIGWIEKEIVEGETVRRYKLWPFENFSISTLEGYKRVWKVVTNIHEWSVNRKKKLKARLEAQVTPQARAEVLAKLAPPSWQLGKLPDIRSQQRLI